MTPASRPSRTRIGRLLVVILFFWRSSVGGCWVCPGSGNRPASMAVLVSPVSRTDGYRITIEQSQVQLLPSPRLDMDESLVVLTLPLPRRLRRLVERVEIGMQWFALLEGRIVAKDPRHRPAL